MSQPEATRIEFADCGWRPDANPDQFFYERVVRQPNGPNGEAVIEAYPIPRQFKIGHDAYELTEEGAAVADSATVTATTLKPGAIVGPKAIVQKSTIGYHVTVGARTTVRKSQVNAGSNSVSYVTVGEDSTLIEVIACERSAIGDNSYLRGASLGEAAIVGNGVIIEGGDLGERARVYDKAQIRHLRDVNRVRIGRCAQVLSGTVVNLDIPDKGVAMSADIETIVRGNRLLDLRFGLLKRLARPR